MEHTEILHEDINEDTLQCLFFPYASNVTDWEQMCNEINKFIETISYEYIWHHDEFRVYLPIHTNDQNDMPLHLVSTTYFGDNVEDEWFIVYIVFEITKQFDVIVQLKDSDDNFLLIEAADYLPAWAKPETTINRVYIYNNHIHIISPETDGNPQLKLKDAIIIVGECKEQTKASVEIQEAVQTRIRNYHDKIKDTIHTEIVNLPLDIATLLALNPKLISAIGNAYCNHDIIDAKVCRNLNFKDCVTAEIKFSKFLYAMLMHSKPIKSIRYSNDVENDKRSLLGLKLTCGYSILMNKPVGDIFSTNQFYKFISNLSKIGYFKEELEGSKEYTNLLEKAKQFYLNVDCPINLSFYHEVLKVMSTQEFQNVKQTLVNRDTTNLNEDNDDWLNIHPDQLDNFLNKQYSKNKNTANVADQAVSSKLSNFLNLTSDFEGIEITEEPDVIDFDCDDFKNAIEKMLNIISEVNDDDHDSDLSVETDDELLEDPKKMEFMNFQENKESVLSNLLQSIKEEEGSTGPSSNILRNIGIHKSDLLDSDDD